MQTSRRRTPKTNRKTLSSCVCLSLCCSSESARIKPGEDGRDEEEERSGDAGDQGGCWNQREHRKRDRAAYEIDGAQLLFAKSPCWATIKMDVVLFYRKVVVYSVSLISLLYVTAIYQRMLKLFIKTLLGNTLSWWSVSVSGDIQQLSQQTSSCQKTVTRHLERIKRTISFHEICNSPSVESVYRQIKIRSKLSWR